MTRYQITNTTATELLTQANRDADTHVIYGRSAIHELQLANEYFRAEGGREEKDWAPVTAGLIRSCVHRAYSLVGEDV